MSDNTIRSYFDFSGLIPPMDIVLQLKGFEDNTYAVQEKRENYFCFQLIEQVFVPLRKQIRLDSNIDLVVTMIKTEVKGQRLISFHLNTADVIYFQEKNLYQVITRREGVTGNIYDLMNDARYVRMHYTNSEFYDRYRREQKKNNSSSNPNRKKKVVRKMKRPNIEEINELINNSVLRFRNAINYYIDASFPQGSDKPVIVGIATRRNPT
jgi:hypothetical protein